MPSRGYGEMVSVKTCGGMLIDQKGRQVWLSCDDTEDIPNPAVDAILICNGVRDVALLPT